MRGRPSSRCRETSAFAPRSESDCHPLYDNVGPDASAAAVTVRRGRSSPDMAKHVRPHACWHALRMHVPIPGASQGAAFRAPAAESLHFLSIGGAITLSPAGQAAIRRRGSAVPVCSRSPMHAAVTLGCGWIPLAPLAHDLQKKLLRLLLKHGPGCSRASLSVVRCR